MGQPQFCVHTHFSQPPAGHPLTGDPSPVRGGLSPYLEHAADACYTPNAEFGTFRRVSFSVNTFVLAWLAAHRPNTYRKIIEADGATHAALATPYHDTVLPLVASTRTRQMAIRWGLRAFEHHFGRAARGFWLPQMAADHDTLLLLAEHKIEYVLLAEGQLHGMEDVGGGPYAVALPGNHQMIVFARSNPLSDDLSFRLGNLGDADHWVRGPVRSRLTGVTDEMLIAATAGEVFGLHVAGGQYFLGQLTGNSLENAGMELTTLAHRHLAGGPLPEAYLVENSSWHGQGPAWADADWRRGFRRALDRVLDGVEGYYHHLAGPVAWPLRDAYVGVILGTQAASSLIAEHLPDLPPDTAETVRTLLTAQHLSLWATSEHVEAAPALNSAGPHYALACALAAATMTDRAVRTNNKLVSQLTSDIEQIEDGASLMRDVQATYNLG